MEDVRLEILKNEKVGMHTYLMVLKLNHSYDIKPGHFVMIKPNDSFDPLNRKGFRHSRCRRRCYLYILRCSRKGTAVMSTLRKGEFVDVLMPLGNGLF
jgi:2-polyprenylphenol hydroxylase and related flavodoxin oxidoreductases